MWTLYKIIYVNFYLFIKNQKNYPKRQGEFLKKIKTLIDKYRVKT